MKLSIIIPVYNLEQYISKCINSILEQTYNDYEIILIDDGSTDGSKNVCDTFSKKYNNIRVKHVKNGGAGYARNIGINMASGEYIMFIDGDDYLYTKNSLEAIVDKLNKKTQVLMYKMVTYYQKSDKYVLENKKYDIDELSKLSKDEQIKMLINECQISIAPCDKIIKRDIIQDNNILFPEGMSGEDIIWSFKLYEHVEYIDYLNEPIYVYRKQRNNSVTSKIDTKKIVDSVELIKRLSELYKDRTDILGQAYIDYTAYQYLVLLSYYYNTKDNKIKDMILNYRWLLKYDNIYKVKKVNNVIKLIGLKNTMRVLNLYRNLRSNNFIKL